MCGIIGYTGPKNAVSIVLEGLGRLEYRGYDSAGIAFDLDGKIEVRRKKGKIKDLEGLFTDIPKSFTAIGHTRWATHGRPSEENAHPHRSDSIVIVHNGIIENYIELKHSLIDEGFEFASETDTEVIAHLIARYYRKTPVLESAIRLAVKDLKGAYAISVMSAFERGKVVGVRKDSPLVCGLGKDGYFMASDIPAFLSYTRDVVFLEDEEMVVMTPTGIEFFDTSGRKLNKDQVHITWDSSMAEKGGYKHFMLKEIYEQPRAIADTIAGRINPERGEVDMEEFGLSDSIINNIEGIVISACGTSWHSALVGKYMIESIARVPVEVDIASELRYREPILGKNKLFIAITQSGETADTLAAQRLAKASGSYVLSICNVIGSTSTREADSVFYTRSGPEIGVASTKAFTTQLVGLYLLAVGLSEKKKTLDRESIKKLLIDLLYLPDGVKTALDTDKEIEKIARMFFKKSDFLYLGRGIGYPVALEGALKLKEVSYIHAEAYPAGELKHGPIALIDEELPIVFIAPPDNIYEKLISNMQEVRSRGGRLISLIGEDDKLIPKLSECVIRVSESNRFLSSVLYTIPLQLLAYHIGVLRGCDVDQPRNLAKSVTVE